MKIEYLLGKTINVSDDTLKYFGSFLWDKPTCPEDIITFFNLIKDVDNPTVIDVGACTGSYTLLPVLKKDIIMYAFEPTRTFEELSKNILLNNVNANLYNVAVSDYDGTGIFNEMLSDLPVALSMLGGTPASHKSYTQKEVKVCKLDTFCSENNIIPTAIKIDVEGNELFVLRGASEIIKKYHPVIFCEYSQENTSQYGYSRKDIYDFLLNSGYFVTVGDNDLLGVFDPDSK